VLWVLVMLTAAANAVNITDGLDGLASGSSALVFGAFVIISFWQFRHPEFYEIVGTLELALLAAALTGAVLGFLWWNAAPAKIIMGDTGSQALGGAMAAMALLTNTHLLLVVLGGLYVTETMSVILQVVAFRGFKRRIFKMAPLHHHFELKGWPETMIIIRFWILAALFVALGLGLFYGDFIASGGIG
jgi:phospho-N-acetylmuramoyl-pentapeptide-transferase